jgi:hypothetical protein
MGQAIYYGNQVLGRLSLRAGDVESAKKYFAASVETRGCPNINTFGPNMLLARELLQAGERDAVLAFLERCRVFLKFGGPSIDSWGAAIGSGRRPDFVDYLRR